MVRIWQVELSTLSSLPNPSSISPGILLLPANFGLSQVIHTITSRPQWVPSRGSLQEVCSELRKFELLLAKYPRKKQPKPPNKKKAPKGKYPNGRKPVPDREKPTHTPKFLQNLQIGNSHPTTYRHADHSVSDTRGVNG